MTSQPIKRFPLLGTAVAVTAAVLLRLALAYRPVMNTLDPTTVAWGASLCTAVIASGLTTLGLLPTLHRVERATNGALQGPLAGLKELLDRAELQRLSVPAAAAAEQVDEDAPTPAPARWRPPPAP